MAAAMIPVNRRASRLSMEGQRTGPGQLLALAPKHHLTPLAGPPGSHAGGDVGGTVVVATGDAGGQPRRRSGHLRRSRRHNSLYNKLAARRESHCAAYSGGEVSAGHGSTATTRSSRPSFAAGGSHPVAAALQSGMVVGTVC
jgi:hypothetical protein